MTTALAVLAAAGLAGCARSRLPAAPKPALTRIRVLPVTPPERFYTYNNIFLGGPATTIANNIKSGYFNAQMEAERQTMGNKLTTALVQQLRLAGYQPQLLVWPGRDPADPNDIDYGKLPESDPVLHVYFEDAGMDSSRLSSSYVPRVNISASLIGRSGGATLYGESIYYGADTRGDKSWSVPAPERFKFPDYAAVLERTQEIVASYDHGIDALAQRVARKLKEQY